jgi:hypothetical protein
MTRHAFAFALSSQMSLIVVDPVSDHHSAHFAPMQTHTIENRQWNATTGALR